MTWKEGLIGIPLALLGAVLAVAAAGAIILTRTDWGREQIREIAHREINRRIPGRIEIGSVGGADLLRGIRLSDVRIYEADGGEFARADTLSLSYRWWDFLSGDLSFVDVRLARPIVELRQSAGGDWNFERAFSEPSSGGETEADATEGRGRRVILEDVVIREGRVTLRTPAGEEDSAAPPGAAGAAGDVEEDRGLRWRTESVDGLEYRVLSVEGLDASLPIARVVAPDDAGRLFQMAELSGEFLLFETPIDVRELRAELRWRGDTLAFDLWSLTLPDSRLFGEGRITAGDPLGYDLMLRGDPVSAADLVWLEPRLPAEGSAHLHFRLQSRPEGTLFEATDAVWLSRDARLEGQFGMIAGGDGAAPRFRDVRLSIGRLETSLIERFTGWTAATDGVLQGRLALDGPLSDLSLNSDLRFQPREGASARVRAEGRVLGDPDRPGARELELVLDTVPFSLIRVLAPDLEVGGLLRGRATLDGRLPEGMDVTFDLRQSEAGLSPTRLRGQGTVQSRGGAPPVLDLTARAEPLALTTLARYYPAIPLRGNFEGRLRARGPLDGLMLEVGLGGADDTLQFDGELRWAEVPSYSGTLIGRRIKLAAFRERLPQSDLDFRIEFEGEGLEPPDLRLGARLHILSSFVGGVRFDSSFAEIRMMDGRLEVDSLQLRGEFGRLSMSGALALDEATSDSLRFDFQADSLGALNPWLFPGREPFMVAELRTNGDGPQSEEEGVPGIGGRAYARGHISGRIGAPNVSGAFGGADVHYGDASADTLSIDALRARGFGDSLNIAAELELGPASIADVDFAGARASVDMKGSSARVEFDLRGSGDAAAAGGVEVVLHENALDFELDSLRLRFGTSEWRLQAPAAVHLSDSGALEVEGVILSSSRGRLEARGSIGTSGPASFFVDLTELDLSELAKAVPGGADFGGVLAIHSELSGQSRTPVIDARVEISDGRLFGASFSSFAGSAIYDAGEISVDLTMIREAERLFRLHGTFPLDLTLPGFEASLPERAIELSFDGDSIPLSLLGIVAADAIDEIDGHADAGILIRGSPSDVSLVGQVEITGAGLRVLPTGIRYDGIAGDLVFRGDRVELSELAFRGIQEGRGRLSGTILISDVDRPSFDVELRAERLPVYNRPEARFSASGTAQLSGPYDRPRVSGNLAVTQGTLFIEEIGRRQQIIDPTTEEFLLLDTLFAAQNGGVTSTGANPFLDNLQLEVDLRLERNTWLRSDNMSVEMAGDLQVRMDPDQEGGVRIDGTLRAIRGDYQFLNRRRFEVVEGTIEFVGTPDINPNLDIVAETRVPSRERPIVIRAVLTGTLEDMGLRLESDAQPPINESDLLSYLLVGRPTYEITRGGVSEGNLMDDLVGGVPQAFFGYALESLLVSETPIDYVEVTQAEMGDASTSYGSGLAPALAATRVEVGWYLAPRLFVSVAQQLRFLQSTSVRIEWRVSDHLTVQGVTEPRLQESHLRDSSSELGRSLGLFLFYGWSY